MRLILPRDAMHSADYAVARRSSLTACQPAARPVIAVYYVILLNAFKLLATMYSESFTAIFQPFSRNLSKTHRHTRKLIILNTMPSQLSPFAISKNIVTLSTNILKKVQAYVSQHAD